MLKLSLDVVGFASFNIVLYDFKEHNGPVYMHHTEHRQKPT